MADEYHMLIRCTTCGREDKGRFCSYCGHPLPGTGEATVTTRSVFWHDFRDLFISLFIPILAVLKTTWLIFWYPSRFFKHLFLHEETAHELPFPLAPLWRRLTDEPHYVLKPIEYYLVGSALLLLIYNALLELDNLKEALPSIMEGIFDQGILLFFLISGLFTMAVVGAFFRIFLGRSARRFITARQSYTFFIYNAGTVLLVFSLLNSLLFDTGDPEEISNAFAIFFLAYFGFAMLYFFYAVAIFPWLIIPRVFPVITYPRAIIATIAAIGVSVPILIIISILLFVALIPLSLLLENPLLIGLLIIIVIVAGAIWRLSRRFTDTKPS